MPKLKHYDDQGTARFVTICCYRSEKYLASTNAVSLLIKHINVARAKHDFRLLGYVIMPEHAHLVLLPPDGMRLGLVVGELKSRMAREYFEIEMGSSPDKRVFWQKRCYDHNCRTVETVKEKINYCHNNPVRRGLVSGPADYLWSSYNWYLGHRDVPLQMDDYEI